MEFKWCYPLMGSLVILDYQFKSPVPGMSYLFESLVSEVPKNLPNKLYKLLSLFLLLSRYR